MMTQQLLSRGRRQRKPRASRCSSLLGNGFRKRDEARLLVGELQVSVRSQGHELRLVQPPCRAEAAPVSPVLGEGVLELLDLKTNTVVPDTILQDSFIHSFICWFLKLERWSILTVALVQLKLLTRPSAPL